MLGHKPKTMDEFHDWIRSLHIGLRRFESLFDRLTIYEQKLTGGPSSNLQSTLQKNSSLYNPFLHWIVKIEETNEQLGELEDLIKDYDRFYQQLEPCMQALLINLISRKLTMTQLAVYLEMSRTHLYTLRTELFRKWVAFYQNR